MEIIALYNEYEIPDTLPKYNNLCFYNFFPTDNIGLSILLYHTLICLSLKICLFYKMGQKITFYKIKSILITGNKSSNLKADIKTALPYLMIKLPSLNQYTYCLALLNSSQLSMTEL